MDAQTRLNRLTSTNGQTHQSRNRIRFGDFQVLNVPLGAADRRLLSSTIESFLSKDEELTLITACFVRDVLLADFPPETFIQEYSLSQSLLQVVKESWEDAMVNYVGFQALMKLASSLRVNIGFLDSPEFYLQNAPLSESLQPSSRSYEQDNLSTRTGSYSELLYSRGSSTDYFLTNYFQLLSGLSSALTYNPTNTHLWLLLESYASLLQKYLTLLRCGNVKPVHLSIEEVLLDISQCFLRNVGLVNPCLVATIMSSLLSNFDETENILLTSDVRRAIWGLASNSKLSETPFVRNYFVQKALHFEQDLRKTSDLNANDNSVENFRSASWWKLDVIQEQRAWRDTYSESAKDPTEIIPSILYGIQNSVEHGGVIAGIDKLWENLLPLVLNKILPEPVDSQLVPPNCQWRETFYRFLSVEPTSVEDEALLIRILDFSSFLLYSMKNSERLLEWILPLVSEKNSALLRVMLHESAQSILSTSSTTFSTLNCSAFDFYLAILHEGTQSNQLGEFFNVCAETLKALYEARFPSTAIFLAVLKSMARLMFTKLIQDKLKENLEACSGLLEIIANGIHQLSERTSDESYINFGALQHGGTILAHLSDILVKDATVSMEWIRSCVPVIPFLWGLENVLIKTSALQICANITSSGLGTFMLISKLESPTYLWRFAYTRLTDLEEPSIVKQRAARVLLNLITNWNQMKLLLGPQVEIPRLKLLEEILGVLTCSVCWYPKISNAGRNSSESKQINVTRNGSASGEERKIVPFITPNVLSLCATLIVKLIGSCEDEKSLLNSGSGSLAREICVILSRVLGSFQEQEASEGGEVWWQQSLISLANTTGALISIVESDRTLSLILIADRQNLCTLMSYFGLSFGSDPKSIEMLSALWRNVFVLISTIIADSGQNFEDLDRLIWNHRDIIFPKLIEWLDVRTPLGRRKPAIDFVSTLLRVTYRRRAEGTAATGFLCHIWHEPDETYGIAVCKKLLGFVDHTLESEERSSILHCLNHLCLLSTTAKTHAIQQRIVKKLVRGLRELGIKTVDMQCNNRKNVKFQDEIKWILTVLTTLFHESKEAKDEGLVTHFPDATHTVFKFIKTLPDPTLFHVALDCLMDFTADFPEGSNSLTLTTGMIGVTSRKIASPSSLYLELLGILQSELELVERSPNLNMKTIGLLISFVKNASFSQECRTLLVKGKVLNFLTRFHHTEIRKWILRYPHLKMMFLTTLVQLTTYQDVQLCLSKIPESIGILIALSENESLPCALHALQILRNMSFHCGNRPRLLHEPVFLLSLATRLNESENLEELECVGVTLWAVTANSEKGKVAAKRAKCTAALTNTIQRLLMKQHLLATGEPSASALSALISLLDKVSTVQNSNNNNDHNNSFM